MGTLTNLYLALIKLICGLSNCILHPPPPPPGLTMASPLQNCFLHLFQQSKEMLANATLLHHPIPEAPTCIATDASDTAVGAVLQQFIQDAWCPIAYFSKKLQPAETRYSTFDRELLAIYLAIKHFRHFVEGRTFHVLTDHKPLIYSLQTRTDKHSPRQIRHLGYISQFTNDIRHIKGSSNVVADALSRVDIGSITSQSPSVVDFQEMARAQQADPDLIG